jgi:hypothetical protein
MKTINKAGTLFLFIIYLVLLDSKPFAQVCNTGAGGMNGCTPSWPSTMAMGPFYIKVKFHKLAGPNGNDIDDSHINESIFEMNSTFNQLGIYFNFDCEYVTHNFEVESAENEQGSNMCAISSYSLPGYLNIFVGAADALYLAVAENSPGNWLIVSGSDGRSNVPAYNSKILSHEIGHCLSLFHTHFGNFETITGNDCSPSAIVLGCEDDTTNSNLCNEEVPTSFNCGDCICDTPADPNLAFNSAGCSYTGSNQFTPLMNNIMSYALVGCLENFTPKQEQRMRDFLASDNVKALNMLYGENGNNVNITSSVATWSHQYYNDKITIKSGAKLTIKNTSTQLSKNFQINIESGGTLVIDNSQLRSCTQLYRGIIAESGSTLIIKNGSKISDALYGVEIQENVSSSITNSYFNDCYVAVNLLNDADLGVFRSNTIQTLDGVNPTSFNAPHFSPFTYIGIKGNNGSSGIIGELGIEENYGNLFKNLHYGIKSEGANLIIAANRFENMVIHWDESNNVFESGTAIHSSGSTFMYARKNQIDNCKYGIFGVTSGVEYLDNELTNCRGTGILLRYNKGKMTSLKDNYIMAAYTGIDLFNINGANVINNTITTTTANEGESTTGIITRFGSKNTLSENNISFLNQKPIHIGIASSSSTGDIITNNLINAYTSSTSKAIALLGGNTHTTNCNLTIDFKDGIYLDNSAGNTLDCNVLESKDSDINVSTNSPIQMIQGNTFSDAETNLSIISSIGQQEHHGNVWYSNTNLGAKLLQGLPLTSSQFFVDFNKSDNQSKNWYPKKSNGDVNSDPKNLFSDQISLSTYQCSGCTYGFDNFSGWFNRSPSPEAICNWLKTASIRLKPSQIRWWQAYIYRLIRKNGISYVRLPPCLKTIVDAVNATKQKNVENINDKLTALSSINQTSTASTYNQVSGLVADAVVGQPFDQSVYNTAIGNLRTTLASNVAAEAYLYSGIGTELALLSNDAAYTDEVLIYSNMLSYLQTNTLPANNSLKLISEGCTDDKGENVFLAKDLLSLIGQVNPLGQSCEVADKRSSKKEKQAIIAKVYPTVSNGVFTIELAGDHSYNIEVLSILGNKAKQLLLQSGSIHLDMSTQAKGIYVLKISDILDPKSTYITKIIIAE